ncbi:FMRFamide receptor-like [Tubulanus polymorphus]|uniref:FMRFamide receptor-like n=1 Tax=Tubulanus polymorphus TaxID=672921 RepID=UPI003DA5DC37
MERIQWFNESVAQKCFPTRRVVWNLVSVIMIGTIGWCGIFANTVTIFVLYRLHKLNQPATSYFILMLLALFDDIASVATVMYNQLTWVLKISRHGKMGLFLDSSKAAPELYIAGNLLLKWTSYTRNSLTVLVTIDRAFNICFPFKAKRLWKLKQCNVVFTAFFIVWTALFCFRAQDRVIVYIINECTFGRRMLGVKTIYNQHRTVSLLQNIFSTYIPVALVPMLNLIMVLSLKRHGEDRNKLTGPRTDNQNKQTSGASRMVFIASAIFVVLNLPDIVYNILNLMPNLVIWPLLLTNDVCQALNSSVNGIFYFIYSPKFKQELKSLWGSY